MLGNKLVLRDRVSHTQSRPEKDVLGTSACLRMKQEFAHVSKPQRSNYKQFRIPTPRPHCLHS